MDVVDFLAGAFWGTCFTEVGAGEGATTGACDSFTAIFGEEKVNP